jgi:transketolase
MEPLYDDTIRSLSGIANLLRQEALSSVIEAGSGHIAGPLGMADIFAALYFHILNHRPKQPQWAQRDRVVLSNGHICPILYAALAHAGYFPPEELRTLRKFGSRLQGHPHRGSLPGVETTSGPLGSGLSQAIGMALAARMDDARYRIFCLMSDGELNEGNSWEAFMLGGRERLSNLTAIIDRNNIQIDGFTEHTMPLEPLRAKLESFNWNVIEINGHDFNHIVSAVAEARAIFEKPTAVIAHTIPGKGVDFMENKFEWHSKVLTKAEARTALHELRTLQGNIVSEHQ